VPCGYGSHPVAILVGWRERAADLHLRTSVVLACSTQRICMLRRETIKPRPVFLPGLLRQERHPGGRLHEEATQRVRVDSAVQDHAKFDPAQFNHAVGTTMSDDERHAEPEPVHEFNAEDKAALAKILSYSLEQRHDHILRIRFLLVVLAPILSTLIWWALNTFPILQAIGAFCIYAGAATWLICGEPSPLRSHRHG
jgi:hypothetical protein